LRFPDLVGTHPDGYFWGRKRVAHRCWALTVTIARTAFRDAGRPSGLVALSLGFGKGTGRKLEKTIGLKTVSLSLRLTIEDSYIHQDRDSNLRYLPGNDSGNDSKLERRVTDMAVVRNRRCNSCWSLEMMLVAWFCPGNLGTPSICG
jgi:hypothetical protein